jgi:hypothetical protein
MRRVLVLADEGMCEWHCESLPVNVAVSRSGWKRNPRMGGAVAVVILAVLVAVAVALHDGSGSKTVGVSMVPEAPLSADPLIDGRPSSLSQAVASTPFHVYRPADPLAGDSKIGSVWVATHQTLSEVAWYYPASGIQIIERRSEWPDPAKAISAMAAQMKSDQGVAVQTLAGVPALVIPEDSDSTGANPTSVTMVINGVYIQIISHQPASDLTSLAATLS